MKVVKEPIEAYRLVVSATVEELQAISEEWLRDKENIEPNIEIEWVLSEAPAPDWRHE